VRTERRPRPYAPAYDTHRVDRALRRTNREVAVPFVVGVPVGIVLRGLHHVSALMWLGLGIVVALVVDVLQRAEIYTGPRARRLGVTFKSVGLGATVGAMSLVEHPPSCVSRWPISPSGFLSFGISLAREPARNPGSQSIRWASSAWWAA